MGTQKPVQRWTAKRRSALMLSILRGETSAQEAARKHGLTVAEVEDWQERFICPVLRTRCARSCVRMRHFVKKSVYG